MSVQSVSIVVFRANPDWTLSLTQTLTSVINSRVRVAVAGDSTNECVCPNGFTKCGGLCYHAKRTSYNYTAAEQYCSDMGGILATPRTQEQNTCAKDVAAAAGNDYFWLGYRNNTVNSFAGADGEGAMSFTNWD